MVVVVVVVLVEKKCVPIPNLQDPGAILRRVDAKGLIDCFTTEHGQLFLGAWVQYPIFRQFQTEIDLRF